MSRFDTELFEDGVGRNVSIHRRLIHFSESTTIAASVMLACAIASVIIANTSGASAFHSFWLTTLSLTVGTWTLSLNLEMFVNDFLMAIFFLLMGLEIKYEFTVGALTDIRNALLPVIAAIGGVLVPICVFLIFNAGNQTADAWGIPTATDIAFAIGILAILGSRIPQGVRLFLSTLAIADDLIAIVVIAIFYGKGISLFWLLMMAVIMILLVTMNRLHVYSISPYLIIGLILWLCTFESGIHATIAGVLLALSIPAKSPVRPASFHSWAHRNLDSAHQDFKDDEPVLAQSAYIDKIDDISKVADYLTPPLSTLKKKIEPFSSFVVLPIFALANAGVNFVGVSPAHLFSNDLVLGVLLGLVVGKPVGILAASFIVVKTHFRNCPKGYVGAFIGASILGGVGFTMSILIAGLALPDITLMAQAKVGILIASVCAGLIGFFVLLAQSRK